MPMNQDWKSMKISRHKFELSAVYMYYILLFKVKYGGFFSLFDRQNRNVKSSAPGTVSWLNGLSGASALSTVLILL